jgi:hypothetical protein
MHAKHPCTLAYASTVDVIDLAVDIILRPRTPVSILSLQRSERLAAKPHEADSTKQAQCVLMQKHAQCVLMP